MRQLYVENWDALSCSRPWRAMAPDTAFYGRNGKLRAEITFVARLMRCLAPIGTTLLP
jgi:hypothetical protein